MSRPWYGTAYLRWVQPLHDKGLIPFCFDCTLLRRARQDDEFYVHDEPKWYARELWDRRYVSKLWGDDWDSKEDSVYD